MLVLVWQKLPGKPGLFLRNMLYDLKLLKLWQNGCSWLVGLAERCVYRAERDERTGLLLPMSMAT